MSWLRLEDNMLDHPKWRRALRIGGDSVLATWFRLVSWCSRNLTDGIVPFDMVSTVASVRSEERSRTLRALCDAGLITRSPSGDVVVSDYLERNPSREQVLAERDRRAEAQKNRRFAKSVTGHASTSEATPCSVPSQSHPIPSQIEDPKSAREPEPAAITEIRVIGSGGTARTITMPSEEPTQSYLDAALMAGVAPKQARDTWSHYFGAGLPPQGVERLEHWLVQRAKERANQVARVAPAAKPVETDPRRIRGTAEYLDPMFAENLAELAKPYVPKPRRAPAAAPRAAQASGRPEVATRAADATTGQPGGTAQLPQNASICPKVVRPDAVTPNGVTKAVGQ